MTKMCGGRQKNFSSYLDSKGLKFNGKYAEIQIETLEFIFVNQYCAEN